MINENITTRLLVGVEINGQKAFNSSESVQQPKKEVDCSNSQKGAHSGQQPSRVGGDKFPREERIA
jgi:hypothetical protein